MQDPSNEISGIVIMQDLSITIQGLNMDVYTHHMQTHMHIQAHALV